LYHSEKNKGKPAGKEMAHYKYWIPTIIGRKQKCHPIRKSTRILIPNAKIVLLTLGGKRRPSPTKGPTLHENRHEDTADTKPG